MDTRRQTLAAFFLVLTLSSALYFFRLGDRPFRNPDEGRNAQIASGMVRSGDWVRPQLYGADYLRKPVLYYWLLAASFKAFGASEAAARLVPALFALAGIAAAFAFARWAFDLRTAVIASLILATDYCYLHLGRYLLIDIMLSFFITSAFYLFYLIVRKDKPGLATVLLFYFCLSMSFLAKGPAGIVIVGTAAAVYLSLTRRWGRALPKLISLPGLLVLLAGTLPWFIAISKAEPRFLKLFFLHEHFSRIASAQYEHQEPWFFYLWVAPVVLMPWTLFWEPLAKGFGRSKDAGQDDVRLFLIVSGLTVIALYSLSSSKLPTYMVPIIPLFSILLGRGWAAWRDDQIKAPARTPAFWSSVLILAVACVFVVVLPAVFERVRQKYHPQLPAALRDIGIIVIVAGVVAARSVAAGRVRRLFAVLLVMMVAGAIFVNRTLELLNPEYTSKAFAAALKPELKAGDRIFIYGQPGAFYDLGFYLDHPVTLVGLNGELELSKDDPGSVAAVTADAEFKALLGGRGRVYSLMRRSDYKDLDGSVRRNLRVLLATERKILVGTAATEPR